MQLIPGGSLIFSFDVESATGTPVNFDAAPTVTFYHNGIADTAWTSYTLTNVVAGHYVLTTTIPSGYALADEISVYVNGTISSVAVGLTAFEAQLANTPDNATVVAIASGALTAIAGAVWNAALATYNAAGSFGAWLQSLVNAPTATQNATAAAAAILATPSQRLATDANGYVTFNNTIPVPLTSAQTTTAVAAASVTLAASQTFSTTGAVGSVAGNVGGSVASVTAPVTLPTSVPAAYATSANQTTIIGAVNAITTNVARAKMVLPTFMARPSTGSSTYAIQIYLYNLEGHLEDANTNTITISAANAAGTSLNTGLSSTTTTRVSTGLYTVNYTVNSTDATGEVIFSIAWSINAVAMSTAMASMVEDAESLATLAAIEAKTNLIGTNSADSPNAVTAQNTITLNLNATVSSRSVYAGTDTPGTTTLLGRLPQALLFDTSGFVKADTESIIGTPPTLTGGNLNVNATNMVTLPAIYSAEVIGGGTVTFTGSLFTTSYESGATVYMIVYNSTGAVYTPSSGQFFSYAEPNWQYYAIAAAEQRPTGFYSGVFPTIPAGNYTVRCFAQAGASPAATDYCFAAATYLPNTLAANLPSIYPADVTEWDGVTVTTVVPNTASVTLNATQAFNNTGQTTTYPATATISGTVNANVLQWNGTAITTAVPNTASVTLATSQSFNNTGQTTDYPTAVTQVILGPTQNFNNTGQTTDYPVAISGNGAYVVMAPVVDQNGVALQSVTVSLSANGYTYTALTNSSGIAGFNLNAATYTVAVFLAGYNLLSLPANAVVSSAMTLPTISLTKQTIAQPSVCQCTGTLYSSFGPVAGASVAFQMILPPPGAPVGVGETNAVVTATTATNGLLTTNNGLNNYVPLFAGATYSITWGIGNQLPPFLVPSASTANLPAMVGS